MPGASIQRPNGRGHRANAREEVERPVLLLPGMCSLSSESYSAHHAIEAVAPGALPPRAVDLTLRCTVYCPRDQLIYPHRRLVSGVP